MAQNIFSWKAAVAILIICVACAKSAVVAADTPPQIYDVSIVAYEDLLFQDAGTTATYEVTIRNTGVMGLSDVRLGTERLEGGWFSSDDTAMIEPGKETNLTYNLNIPDGSEGTHAFSLVVFASSGRTGVSNMKIVSLNIMHETTTTTSKTAPPTTETTQPEPQPTETPEPPETISTNLILVVAMILIGYLIVKKFL